MDGEINYWQVQIRNTSTKKYELIGVVTHGDATDAVSAVFNVHPTAFICGVTHIGAVDVANLSPTTP